MQAVAVTRDQVPDADETNGGGLPRSLSRLLVDGQGGLARLGLDAWHGRLARLEVHVAPVTGAEAERHDTDQIVRALNRRWGFRVRPLQRGLTLKPGAPDAEAIAGATGAARRWLSQAGGDLFVWGRVPSPGTTIHLRLISATPAPETQVGGSGPLNAIGLPIDFSRSVGELLHTVALAATVPADPGKARGRFYRLATSFKSARQAIGSLPRTLTPFERGSLHAAFGDVAALLAQHPPYRPLADMAANSYSVALHALDREEDRDLVGQVQRNRGLVLLLKSEADYDAGVVRDAVSALRAAAGVLDRHLMPGQWAATQDRLGEAIYRLEALTHEQGLLEEAIACHRAAIAALERSGAATAWARAKHNLARAAQMLGEQQRNRALCETAVASCRDALTVHNRDSAPFAWAALQNTLGSALFLLGRQTGADAALAQAAEAFASAAEIYAQHDAAAARDLAKRNEARVATMRAVTRDKHS